MPAITLAAEGFRLFSILLPAMLVVGILLVAYGVSLRLSDPNVVLPDMFEEREIEERAAIEKRLQEEERQLDGSSPMAKTLRGLMRPLENTGLARWTTKALLQADLAMTTPEWLGLWMASPVVVFAVFFLFNHSVGISLFMALALGLGGPWFYLRTRRSKRLLRLQSQLPDVVALLSSSLRGGLGVPQAIQHSGESMSDPVGEEFRRISQESALSVPLPEALQHASERIANQDFNLIAIAIQINQEVGGNLADVLDTVRETMRARIKLQSDIRTQTAQVRGSGYILAGLPFALMAFLSLVARDFESRLFTNPIGLFALGFCAVLIATGSYIISRIAKIEI